MIHQIEVEDIHKLLIENFGGLAGIKEHKLLSSALNRPFQVFDGKELYCGIISKAAALIEGIISNQPFIDGNKRTGYMIMRLFLIKNKINIEASQNEKYDFVMGVASGKCDFYRIVDWINKHAKNF